MKKILKWTSILLGGLVGLTFLAGLALYPGGMKTLTRTYSHVPVETLNGPAGPDSAGRGRRVAILWSCAKCHGENLSGALLADDPFLGTIPAANLTSGKGGIAQSYSDADWIRAIRHGVKPDSHGEVLMDNYSTMSDRDLGDLLAYLKELPPVDTDYHALRIGPLVAIASAVGLFTPAAASIDPAAPRPADPTPGATIEYGRYLSTLCTECHSANLGKKLDKWSQEDFTRAMKTGILPNGKHLTPAMPLKTYGELNDTELIALWLFFMGARP
jgi:mono/diheme cytochrome c family protein